jgi:hypothetical protein
MEPGALFDVMAPLIGDDGIMMVNHPWDDPFFGRDLGYLRAIEFDPRRPVPTTDDGSRNGLLARRPAGGHRNMDWDVMEVQNGSGPEEIARTRPLWFSLLSQGHVVAGSANSDSHSLMDEQLGWPRTLVRTELAGFDVARFDTALRDGHAIGSNGVVIIATVGPPGAAGGTGVGFVPHPVVAGDVVRIEVRAAPWIPVEEVRIVTSRGEQVVAAGADLLRPADPLGAEGVVRWRGEVSLASLDALLDGDDWLVVEAGMPLPPYADLDDDGVPDTGDNDGDGDVDRDDVEDGEDTGPHHPPPDPTDEADPRFLITRVVLRAWPFAFTNPFLLDADGGGWTAPGLP